MKENIPADEFYRSLPKKRTAACAIFRNQEGKILILHKDYSEKAWNLPGGVMEAGESPTTGLAREIWEEIGLEKNSFIFLGVDYKPSRGEAYMESLQFVFDGGILDETEIRNIRLSEEHSEFKFLPDKEAIPLLTKFLAKRLATILSSSNLPIYMEAGERKG
jgi:8-oxo-dGTP pyrophosphatase MutT (NUDIX family)